MGPLHFFKRFRTASILLTLLATFACLPGCGYTLQSSRNPLFTKAGVRKVYIAAVRNNTFKAGVENVAYDVLVRVLRAHDRVILVGSSEEADAVLYTDINQALYSASANVSVNDLNPQGLGGSLPSAGYIIASEYMAQLGCGFRLVRRPRGVAAEEVIWSAQLKRAKPFPASNQLDVLGSTSALINESEFDRVLPDLAKSVMEDLHESMLAMF